MRAAEYTAFGGPDDVVVHEVAEPNPNSGEVVVSVEATSLNHHDLWILEGKRGRSDELPFRSGLDLAGTVDEVGPGVSSVSPGDRVVLCPIHTCGTCRFCREGPENICEEFGLYHGGFAERALVDADRLVRLPDDVDTATAAALPVAYMTAWRMLRVAGTRAGDTVFVPGATGGVGIAAVQLVSVLGGRSIGTTRSESKTDTLTRIGTEHVVTSDDVDEMREAVERIGEPDVVVNHLGGPFTDLGVAVVRRGGTVVSCGGTAGTNSDVDLREVYLGHKRLLGSTMGTQHDLEQLVEFVADGRLTPHVGSEYLLDDIDEAFRAMQRRELTGKAIVRP